jgi:hypothetical protein
MHESKISQKSKEAKRANWQWKNNKKTNSNSDSEKKEMVRRKRELRQLQRQARASKKNNMISDIMQASENDSKTFHKLIRMQRSNESEFEFVFLLFFHCQFALFASFDF